MIEADLAVVGIAELATPEGRSARLGPDLGRLRTLGEAAIACRGDRIVFVGPEREFHQGVAMAAGSRTLDARGATVLPGFVDAHTHLPFAGWRESEFNERLQGATYSQIAARGGGILSTVQATRAASRDELAALTRQRLDAMLVVGTTLAEAKSGYGLSTEAEIKQLEALRLGAAGHPVQVVPTFLGAHSVPKERREDRERYVDEIVTELAGERESSAVASGLRQRLTARREDDGRRLQIAAISADAEPVRGSLDALPFLSGSLTGVLVGLSSALNNTDYEINQATTSAVVQDIANRNDAQRRFGVLPANCLEHTATVGRPDGEMADEGPVAGGVMPEGFNHSRGTLRPNQNGNGSLGTIRIEGRHCRMQLAFGPVCSREFSTEGLQSRREIRCASFLMKLEAVERPKGRQQSLFKRQIQR
jgi:hypothetical protein